MRLKELGITHILNAAAMKKKLRILLGIRWEKDIKDTVDTGASYYRGTKIRYCGLPTTKTSDISKYFMPAAKFILEARKNSESKIFYQVFCSDNPFGNFFDCFLFSFPQIRCSFTAQMVSTTLLHFFWHTS